MKKAIKKWGVNTLNVPQEYIQEILILNDNDLIPNGYELATEEEIDNNMALYSEEASIIFYSMQEKQDRDFRYITENYVKKSELRTK